MENPFNTEEHKPKHSTLLIILAVLTFIGSGLNFVGSAFVSLNFQATIEIIDEVFTDLEYEEATSQLAPIFESYIENMEKAGVGYYALFALLAALCVVGAALMLRMNKLGFHFYASAQLVLLVLPTIFGIEKFPGAFGIILTGLFIWLYAKELKIFER